MLTSKVRGHHMFYLEGGRAAARERGRARRGGRRGAPGRWRPSPPSCPAPHRPAPALRPGAAPAPASPQTSPSWRSSAALRAHAALRRPPPRAAEGAGGSGCAGRDRVCGTWEHAAPRAEGGGGRVQADDQVAAGGRALPERAGRRGRRAPARRGVAALGRPLLRREELARRLVNAHTGALRRQTRARQLAQLQASLSALAVMPGTSCGARGGRGRAADPS